MLLDSLTIDRPTFEAGTGWKIEPQGACRGDVCVPLTDPTSEMVDVAAVADQMGMPLVHDEAHGLWSLGPWSGNSHTLVDAAAPELVLPDLEGTEFRLSSLRGQKVLLVAWAPY